MDKVDLRRRTADIENTSVALFGQGSYDINEKLMLMPGLRDTDVEKESINIRYAKVIPSEVLPMINLDYNHLSWDLSLPSLRTSIDALVGQCRLWGVPVA